MNKSVEFLKQIALQETEETQPVKTKITRAGRPLKFSPVNHVVTGSSPVDSAFFYDTL